MNQLLLMDSHGNFKWYYAESPHVCEDAGVLTEEGETSRRNRKTESRNPDGPPKVMQEQVWLPQNSVTKLYR